jgi:hypothetical protein
VGLRDSVANMLARAARESYTPRTDLPTRAYHGTGAVFPEFKYEAELNQIDPLFAIDRALGPHAARDPAIASHFADRHIKLGMPFGEQPHVIPLRIPAEEKFLQVEQPILKARENIPLWQRVANDEQSVEKMAARQAYSRDPDLLTRYVQNRTGATLADARSRAMALLEGESVKVGQKKRTLDEVIDQYGGRPYSPNDRLTMANIARKAWQDQGYEGLRYINTAPWEAGAPGVKDPTATSYIIFDPRNMRSEFAKFDPKMAWSRDLMSGLAGGGLVAGTATALAPDQAQAAPRFPFKPTSTIADALASLAGRGTKDQVSAAADALREPEPPAPPPMPPRPAPPPSQLAPMPANPAMTPQWVRQYYLPHLSDPATYQTRLPPTIATNAAGKTYPPEMTHPWQGALADVANLTTNLIGAGF